jgi:hypothetical protein
LSDTVIDKADLKQKVKISSKAKLSQYSQLVSVAYVQSLAKLTHQVAIVDAKVNTNCEYWLNLALLDILTFCFRSVLSITVSDKPLNALTISSI